MPTDNFEYDINIYEMLIMPKTRLGLYISWIHPFSRVTVGRGLRINKFIKFFFKSAVLSRRQSNFQCHRIILNANFGASNLSQNLRSDVLSDIETVLTHWGRDKMAVISQTTYWRAFSWMKIYVFRWIFHWSLFPRFQLTITQHWFR